jgi:hypothetical protein
MHIKDEHRGACKPERRSAPVCELQQHHTRVVNHGQDECAERGAVAGRQATAHSARQGVCDCGTRRGPRALNHLQPAVPPQQLVQLTQARHAVHQRRNLRAKRGSNVVQRRGRVIHHVVQQRRNDGRDRAGRRGGHKARHDARRLHCVRNVRLACAANLASVRSCRKLRGAHDRRVGKNGVPRGVHTEQLHRLRRGGAAAAAAAAARRRGGAARARRAVSHRATKPAQGQESRLQHSRQTRVPRRCSAPAPRRLRRRRRPSDGRSGPTSSWRATRSRRRGWIRTAPPAR